MDDKESQSKDVDQKKDITYSPLVSIITPVLNGIRYLETCIQSVLTQSYPHIEHIIVDGGSTDGTVEMLSSYQAKYPDRIRFISEPDKGVGEAWNKGLRMAKGEIFGFLGSDDMSEPCAMQTVVEFFRANPDAYFVFGGLNYINEKGEIIGKHPVKEFDLKELINDWSAITTPAAFYRREVIEKVGWFDTLGNDLDFLIRVGKVFQIYRIDKVLASFRIHKESQTTGNQQMWLPGARRSKRMWLREDYIISRRHGASIFSPKSRRYYEFVIIEELRPILGFTYPLIKKVLRRRVSSAKKEI